jgi:hypothetical protein
MPDGEADRIPELYRAHLEALGPSLPSDARRLWSDVSLHDGLVLGRELGDGRLRALFRSGDRQSGYIDAGLTYGAVARSEADEQFLRWVHRLLFWPYREVCIYFEAFTLDVNPASGRFES